MDFKKILNLFKYINFVNYYKESLIYRFLLTKYYYKKRILLKNSHLNDLLKNKHFKNSFNIDEFRKSFFKSDLFPYSRLSEKEELIHIIKRNCNKQMKAFIEYADKVLNNEFKIFEKNVNFDKKIKWFFGFYNNYLWPFKDSEKINIRPFKNIDVKYVWELNRHQFLTYLGFAYYITNDSKYAIDFKNKVLDWIRKNPPLIGINWRSGLEISLRLISWIFTLLFFKDSTEINNNNFFRLIFNSMFQHAYYLKYFYTRRSFNHTVGDLFGVYLFSKMFEKYKLFKKWNKSVFKLFVNQISLQTRKDGVNIEQSVAYHRFVLEFFTLFYIINREKLPQSDIALIEKMYDYLINIIKPNGDLPLIGDGDDGKVLLLSFYDKNHHVNLINLGLILFKRGDFKFYSENILLTSILLMGKSGFNSFNGIVSYQPQENFRFYEKSGYVLLRNGYNPDSSYLFFDLGKFGPRNAAHTHSSISNFIFSFKGNNIINDSGTYSYNKSWEKRIKFRGAFAHNILTIDKKNQAEISDWFSWKYKPKIKREINLNGDNIVLSCFHNGYEGFIVNREIITSKDLDYLIIKDVVIQTRKTVKNKIVVIEINFHLDKSVKFKVNNNKVLINQDLLFEFSSNQNFELKVKKSEQSPTYGVKYDNYNLTLHLENTFESINKIEVETKILSIN